MTIVVDLGWLPVGVVAAFTFLNFKFMRYNVRSEQNMVNLCNNILMTLKLMEKKIDEPTRPQPKLWEAGAYQPTANS